MVVEPCSSFLLPGWYDFFVTNDDSPSFSRQLAGHVETGRDSVTDPMIGASSAHEMLVG